MAQPPPLSDIEAKWAREIEDRVAVFDRDETKTYAAEDVFAETQALMPLKRGRFVEAARRVFVAEVLYYN